MALPPKLKSKQKTTEHGLFFLPIMYDSVLKQSAKRCCASTSVHRGFDRPYELPGH